MAHLYDVLRIKNKLKIKLSMVKNIKNQSSFYINIKLILDSEQEVLAYLSLQY
jgi:hypothetical protein